ncbi:MAG: preprotein translocase subunit SecA [Candidatus Spechtbacteria bacterium]|nr:preprotein translocase subunit SecA [Candidatus Spechtbacteria bacterium]
MSMFSKVFGDPNEREVKKLQGLVNQVNSFEQKFGGFSDEQMQEKTEELKRAVSPPYEGGGRGGQTPSDSPFAGGRSLDEILPEAFALVREASKRTLKQRHYDVQLLGGIVLHQGKIAEMKTGEGKTLAATTAVYLNALTRRGVHVVTVNDYLAKRDTVWMGQIYGALGLSVGSIVHDQAYLYDSAYQTSKDPRDEARDVLGGFKIEESYLRPCSRKEAYAADITYGTNNEFGFDYLRDNLAYSKEEMVQRGHYFAIVDEVDSILIDEARTPLIISAPDEESTSLYKTFAGIVPELVENEDYNKDEKMRTATITEQGVRKLEKILGIENIYDSQKGGGIRYVHQLEQALRAKVLFEKDKDYVIKNGEVIIVDEFTGRLMPGRRYSEGLHQALEAKEGVEVQKESRTLASITFQNYFRMYEKLAGMTGTAMTSAEEFDKVYKLQIVAVPTNKPMIRKDHSDLVLRTRKGKMLAVVEEVKKRNAKGQPVLVGTTSIQNNEAISMFFEKAGIKHEVLNAKNHEKEGAIIAQAGRFAAVTVATNMAGRGVDIILGGNPQNPEEARKVCDAGGLFVLGTERHEARRIDNQLRGRSGRQGDPGESQFFVSLEDDLMRIFGGDRIKSLMTRLKIPEDQPIASGLISGAIESAQGKIEGYHFDARKHVLDYDEVMNKQRQVIYEKRRRMVAPEEAMAVLEIVEEELGKMVDFHTSAEHPAQWNIEEIFENTKSMVPLPNDFHEQLSAIGRKGGDPEALRDELFNAVFGIAKKEYEEREQKVGSEKMRGVEKFVLLRTLDTLWMDHLDTMEHLRDSVSLRAYAQRDPLVEYKREGIKMFEELLNQFQLQVMYTIFKVELQEAPREERLAQVEGRGEQAGKSSAKTATADKTIGRNDPCHCGSGKKYKKCHGK